MSMMAGLGRLRVSWNPCIAAVFFFFLSSFVTLDITRPDVIRLFIHDRDDLADRGDRGDLTRANSIFDDEEGEEEG